MTNEMTVLDIIDRTTKRREERRAFLRAAGGGAAMIGGLSLLGACNDDDSDVVVTPSPTPTSSSTTVELNVLNFALNLEYLEAQFYAYAAFGTGLAASLQTGVGTQGAVITTASATTGTGIPRAVTFATASIAEYAREIAIDEIAHVAFLRSVLGSAASAQPQINISGGAGGPFAAAATAAGVPGGSTFDPYANENNFLLGAFIFEDVGVTAYKGAAPLITNKTYLEAAAGILAAEAYHAGLVRTVLYNRGLTVTDLRTNADLISNARDTLDGSSDDDQGITGTATASNIFPGDANAIAYSRNTNQVHHIVYLNATAGISSGGFFPAGTNSAFRVAAANP